MDKKIAGLIGATALAALGASSAQAAERLQSVMTANSYADLLQPIADPVPLLKASDAVLVAQADDATPLTAETVQYHHHHHHHHRAFLRRLLRPRHYHHHHHHHHHHHYY